jgi:hypothetical protein
VNNTLSNNQRNEVEQHTLECEFCSDAIQGFETNNNTVKPYLKFKDNFNKKRSKVIYYISATAASVLIIVMFKNTSSLKEGNDIVSKVESFDTEKQFKSAPIQDKKIIENRDSIVIVEKKVLDSLYFTSSSGTPENAKKHEVSSTKNTYNWTATKENSSSANLSKSDKFYDINSSEQGNLNNGGSKTTDLLDEKNSIESDDEIDFEIQANSVPIEQEGQKEAIIETEVDPDKHGELERSNSEYKIHSSEKVSKVPKPSVVIIEEVNLESKERDISAAKKRKSKRLKAKLLQNSRSDKIMKEVNKNAIQQSPFKTGMEAYNLKDWNLAIQHLQDVKKEKIQKYYEANYLLGKAYIEIDNKVLAEKHFIISSTLDSDWKTKSDIELNKLK